VEVERTDSTLPGSPRMQRVNAVRASEARRSSMPLGRNRNHFVGRVRGEYGEERREINKRLLEQREKTH
jgi:hypothetical protein